jgi:hypothetical protein
MMLLQADARSHPARGPMIRQGRFSSILSGCAAFAFRQIIEQRGPQFVAGKLYEIIDAMLKSPSK